MQIDLETRQTGDMVEAKKEETKSRTETQRKLKMLMKESPLSDSLGKLLYRTKPMALQELLDAMCDDVFRQVKEICVKYRMENEGFRDFKEKYFHLDIPIVIQDGIPADVELQRYESSCALQRVIAYASARYRDYEKEHGMQENPATDIMAVSTIDYLHTDELLMELTVMEKLSEGRELRINILSVNGEMADNSTRLGRLMSKLMRREVKPEDFLPEFPRHAQALRELKKEIEEGDLEIMSEFERIERQLIEETAQAAEARGEARGKAEGRAEILGTLANAFKNEALKLDLPEEYMQSLFAFLHSLFPDFRISVTAIPARRI